MTPTRIILYQHDDDPAAYGVCLADNRATVATITSAAPYARAVMTAADAARLYQLPIEIEDDTPVSDDARAELAEITAAAQEQPPCPAH